MKPGQTPKGSAVIANPRWLAYATASATSAFACAHPNTAEATIHYSGAIDRKFVGCQATANFRLDQAGHFIRLRHTSFACGDKYGGTGFFNVAGIAGASIAGFYNGCPDNLISVSKLQPGQLISTRQFLPAGPQSALLAGTDGECTGQFVGRGFIGFKFNNGKGDQYGWVRIQARPYIGHHFVLYDYAYADPGEPIKAGQKSSNKMVPDQGSLGLLALGAAGLLVWRKRRSFQ